MKKAKTNKLLHLFTLFLLSGLMWCCIDERQSYKAGDTDLLKTVTFSVKVPGGNTPKTYALTESDENEVSSIAILLFDGSDNYTYQPIYSNTITTDPGDSKIKRFTVEIPEGTYDLMILANANPSLTAILSNINTGDSKESVIDKLLLANSVKWNTVPGSAGYMPIPMWGERAGLAVSSNMPANNPVTLIRMVAKIDLSLGTDAQGKFNLQSLRLYNYTNQGQIAPTPTNWNSATSVATAPSVPASAQKPATPVNSPLLFDDTAITKDPATRGIACLNQIYTFEAPMGSSSTLSGNTCLVVGGVYGDDTQPTYYRIDLANTIGTGAAATTTYHPLLRNHRYKITIANIKASGFTTPEEAFNSRPINIVASLIEWNEALITGIAYDEQYMLGVSGDEFTFTREERTTTSDDNTLFVSTDYPSGWSVAQIVDAEGNDVNSETNSTSGWLKLSPTSGDSGATVETRLILTENKTSQARTANIHFTAGRLSYMVTVHQSIDAKLTITITNEAGTPINLLEFPFTTQDVAGNTAPAAQKFNLNWTPASSDLIFSAMENSSFNFATGAGLDVILPNGTLTSGSKSYKVQAPVIPPAALEADPFYERSSIYLYSVSDGAATINKSFTLRQRVYNLITDVKSSYWLDGSTYTFHVRCNTGWRIQAVNPTVNQGSGNLLNLQTSDNLLRGTTGGFNTGVGDPVTFRVANNKAGLIGKIDVIFESTDTPKKFSDVTVTLNLSGEYYPPMHNGWAGSNIYWNGEELTFDDVDGENFKNYQGVYFQWGGLIGISPWGTYGSSTKLYTPEGSTTAGNTYWSALTRVPSDEITSTPPAGKSAEDRSYLYELDDQEMESGRGDVCKYLTKQAGGTLHGKKWRMPTSNEFEELTNYSQSGSFTATTSNKEDGTYSISSGYMKKDIKIPFFPASGNRGLTGTITNVSQGGLYWSASPAGTNSYYRAFYKDKTPLSVTGYRVYGFTVRCVVE